MAKKPVNKTKSTVTGLREAKHSAATAMTGSPKKTAKSARTGRPSDTITTKPKGAKSTQATGRITRTVTKPSGTIQRSARIDVMPRETEPTFEQIRNRAYENYLMRGAGPGDAASDWLQAERELRQLPAAQSGVAR